MAFSFFLRLLGVVSYPSFSEISLVVRHPSFRQSQFLEEIAQAFVPVMGGDHPAVSDALIGYARVGPGKIEDVYRFGSPTWASDSPIRIPKTSIGPRTS